jgi:hypothetical protein
LLLALARGIGSIDIHVAKCLGAYTAGTIVCCFDLVVYSAYRDMGMSALGRSDDRKGIILFSANEGLSFANLTQSLGDFASTLFRKPISLLSYGS